MARALFGVQPFTAGVVELNGKPVHIRSPRQAIRAGIGFLTEDRKLEGLVLPQSVRDNALLALRSLRQMRMRERRSRRRHRSLIWPAASTTRGQLGAGSPLPERRQSAEGCACQVAGDAGTDPDLR